MIEFKEIYREIQSHTLVSEDRCRILYDSLYETNNIKGDVFECGVFKGGTAMMLSAILPKNKSLHLFDTFEGMPSVNTDKDNYHKKGDFSNTSLESVIDKVEKVSGDNVVWFHKGFIPDTFKDKSHYKISFAHVDVDIYQSVLDCCEFIYPRLCDGGIIVFDDYGFNTCKGAKLAVDEFFSDKPENVEVLNTKQAVVRRVI